MCLLDLCILLLLNGEVVTQVASTHRTLEMRSCDVLLLRAQVSCNRTNKQRVLMHGHQGWNVRHGLCHIYMIYVYIWVVYSFCLFCCLFIIVTTQFVALYKPCKPKPKPSTYDPTPPHPPTPTPPPPPPPPHPPPTHPPTLHPHPHPPTHPPPPPPPTHPDNHPLAEIQRPILSQSNKYAINMQIQTISVSK